MVLIVLDSRHQVLLSVDGDLLVAVAIVDRNLIEAARSLIARGDHARLFLARREGKRWHHFCVVHTPNDDWAVGVALFKRDDHFLPAARNVNHSVAAPRPHSPDTHPTGTVSWRRGAAVPVKSHFHPAVLVCEDFLRSGVTIDHRCLRAV